MFGWNKNVLILRTCLCINWIFVFIRTKCAPQSKSSVRPAAAIYSRDKCDRSHIHVTQMFYIHVTLCFIFRGQAYGFMWKWWEVAQCSGFTDESWCNVQVGQKMFGGTILLTGEKHPGLDQVFDCFRNNKPTI